MEGCFYGNWTRSLGPGVSPLCAPMGGILFSSCPRLNRHRVAVGARDGGDLGAPHLSSYMRSDADAHVLSLHSWKYCAIFGGERDVKTRSPITGWWLVMCLGSLCTLPWSTRSFGARKPRSLQLETSTPLAIGAHVSLQNALSSFKQSKAKMLVISLCVPLCVPLRLPRGFAFVSKTGSK